ncbi:type VI secretion system tube protein Hcp [Intrasporangium sp.]|uniref:Hcp family type VI secretion system effector n=1 Tax=Intrasporangium sp. TaxID=1925024 RepID=UPI00293A9ADA|nr:type VI secretion system tube protein Hcp [Intrasporangium sp.]MDV3221811.1 type VI secretion system tube protein Hcp [Intrasporangium sp.]
MPISQTSGASRRGVLKGGALGLGSVAGAFALSGVSSQAAEAGLVPAQAGLAAAALGGPADYYLRIDDIKGESADEAHRDWIEVLSYSWGASSASAAATGAGAAAARSTISPLNVMTGLSAASPLLFLATMDGRHIASAVLEGVTADETRNRFLELRMADVVITSYQSSGSSSAPTDSASLTFSRIMYSYWQQKSDGSVGAKTSVTWDVVRGQGS